MRTAALLIIGLLVVTATCWTRAEDQDRTVRTRRRTVVSHREDLEDEDGEGGLLHLRDGEDDDDDLDGDLVRGALHGGVRPPMLKASLTQIGYIQFLRYIVDVPAMQEASFCVWLRSRNLTHNHPIFSYSKNEKERYGRAWVSPASGPGARGPRLPPRLHFYILERAVFVEPLPEAGRRRWVHICCSWDGRSGGYTLHVDGRQRRAGVREEVAGLTLPGGGDVVVGQEYTDFDKGLDDGVEGDVFGFYLFRTAQPADEHPRLQRRVDTAVPQRLPQRRAAAVLDPRVLGHSWPPSPQLPQRRKHGHRFGPPAASGASGRVHRLHAHCTDLLAPEDRADVVVSWPTTPVRVFGGAIIGNVNVKGGCGDF